MALHGRIHMLTIQLYLLIVAVTLASAQAPRPTTCSKHCGDVEIPYPFGIEPSCYMEVPGQEEQQFKVTCDQATTPPLLKFLNGDILNQSITDISVGVNEMQVMLPASRNCYPNGSYDSSLYRHSQLNLSSGYTFSDKNRVFIIGCNKISLYQGFVGEAEPEPTETEKLGTSGVSLCQDLLGPLTNNCSGVGCSQTSIHRGLHNITLDVWTIGTGLADSAQWTLDYPCSYGFIVDERNFTFAGNATFKMLDGSSLSKTPELPVVVNWEIGKDNCEAAVKTQSSYACKAADSECVNGTSGGYFCLCNKGYQGNPYILDGCEDVNECTNKTVCHPTSTCENLVGNYTCKCPKGQTNNGDYNSACVKITGNSKNTALQISLGVCLSFVVILVVSFWMYCGIKRKRFNQLKERYFENNGGHLLQQRLKDLASTGTQVPKIFTEQELKIATNNFADSGKIGEGGYGLVYKGTLPDKKEVAIKVSKSTAPMTQSNQFVNEVIILSQINHRNVVRLLGCCLQTQMPYLVYEFVSNGTLYEHIHKKNDKGPLSFRLRMKIATETAGSLAYLHYHHSTQIVHRDVKATNILLDENYTAKVSDFGASKLVPDDQNQLSTLVQGTLGYLDPEYLQSNTLTEKSDVYSFGVVLVELITSQVAISHNKPEAERNLANCFIISVEENRLDQILDHEIIKEGSFEIAEQVAHLAKRCLSLKGGDRPTMKEVASELEAILAVMAKHPGGKPNSSPKETDYLLAVSPSNAYAVDASGDEGEVITSIDYDQSMQDQSQMMKPYDGGR
ncbi:wall-associated receptor kinase 5-like [Argentina anserina]|uniref:wall-associated receptor kinase 5-like n=1 Tax=Argentina anserina TaxID=57926 RepID=UPI0021766A2A|nr:wall-associated receptor kinase 5-like [Potentilla anserina]